MSTARACTSERGATRARAHSVDDRSALRGSGGNSASSARVQREDVGGGTTGKGEDAGEVDVEEEEGEGEGKGKGKEAEGVGI